MNDASTSTDLERVNDNRMLGRPFPAGVSGNPRGKSPGTLNRVTLEARQAAAEIVDNPAYRANLMARAIAGKLPPPVETLLWHYAKGVPKHTVDVNQRVTDVTKMSTEDLRAEITEALSRL